MRVFAPFAILQPRRLGVAATLLALGALAGCDLNPIITACTVTIAPTVISVPVNTRQQVVGTAFDCKGNSISSKKISFSSADPTVATVAIDGSVIGIAPGQTTVSAVADGKSGVAQVTVTPEVVFSVQVTPTSLTLRRTNSRALSVVLKNVSGTVITGRSVVWSSSNSSIASVDQNGNVIALAPGQVVVTATSGSAQGSANIIITEIPIGSCSILPATQKVTVSASVQPALTLRDTANNVLTSVGRTILWSSDNDVVATVISTGVITARKAGTAKITAADQNNTQVNCFTTVEVVDARIVSVVIAPRTGSLRIGAPRGLGVTLLDSLNQNIPAGRIVTWSSLDPSIASVSSVGIVTGLSLGTARISVNAEGVRDTVSFPVTKIPVGTVRVAPLQISLLQGATAQLTATVEDSTGAIVTDRIVEWISNDPTKVSVTSTGRVTALAPGVVGVSAISEGKGATSNVIVNQIPVDSIRVDSVFTLVRGTSSAFTIFVRDAQGAELRGRTIVTTSDKPSIALVNPSTTTTTVTVGGVAVGEAIVTLQALNSNGQNEGKPSRVRVIVTAPAAPTSPP